MSHPRIYLYRRIVEAKLFIDKNYARKNDVGDIADQAFFSKFHFIRLFKEIYGKTPHQYLISVRVENAKLLLASGISVSDTCLLVGFESYTSFTGLFKKMVRITPSAYLSERGRRQAEIARVPLAFIPGCFAEHNGWVKNRNIEEVAP